MSTRRRDPRAPSPRRFQRNATAAESCEFYGVADGLSQCRVPRSCADCLVKPGCMLTATGTCQEAKEPYADWFLDARVLAETLRVKTPALVVRFERLTATPVFFAHNATYCSASDAMCVLCRAQFEQMARTNRSTREALDKAFCVGADGRCVCTGVCEVPAYRATKAQDYQCEGPTLYYVEGHSVPDFSSKRRDPRAPLLPRVLVRESVETCAYYNGLDARGCRQPRLASDCLRRADCMISDGCVDAQYPANDLSDATKISLSLSYVRYATSNSSVCASGDGACPSCASDIDLYSQGQAVDSSNVRCVGSRGCICEAFLAYQDKQWLVSRSDPDCGSFMANPDQVIIAVVVGFITIMLLVGSCLRYALVRGRFQEAAEAVQGQAARVMRHMLDNVPGGLDLDLFGWRRYHLALRENEHRLLRDEEVVSPVARPIFELKDLLIPTAPPLEEREESTAPMRSDPMALASAPVVTLSGLHPGEADASFSTAPASDGDPTVAISPPQGARQRRVAPPRQAGPIG